MKPGRIPKTACITRTIANKNERNQSNKDVTLSTVKRITLEGWLHNDTTMR